MRLLINIDDDDDDVKLYTPPTRSILPSDKILNIKLPAFEKDGCGGVLFYIFYTASGIFFDFNATQLPIPLGELKYRLYSNLDLLFMPELFRAISDALNQEVNSVEDIKNTQESCFVVSFIIEGEGRQYSSPTITNLFINWLYEKGFFVVEPFSAKQPPYFTDKEDEGFFYLYFLDILPAAKGGSIAD